MSKYFIKVYDKNFNEVAVITDFADDVSISKKINQATELTFKLYYRDKVLLKGEEVILKYNTPIRLYRVRSDGSAKDEGLFLIRDRVLEEEMITFKAYGYITRLNDFLFSPEALLKGKTVDVVLKECLYKHVIERTWTWKSDWDNCPIKQNVNTELLSGPDYGDAVCLAWEKTGDIHTFKSTGYIITEGIKFSAPPYKIKIRVKGTISEETETWFNYDFKTNLNPNWRLNDSSQTNWKQYKYEERDEGYHELEISGYLGNNEYITDLRVGVVLYTSDNSSEMEIDGIKYYGKSPVLYAIQVIALYPTEFSGINIPTGLNRFTIDTDMKTSFDTSNLKLFMDICDKYKIEVLTDTNAPAIAVNQEGFPQKIGADKSDKIVLVEGDKGDIISAPIDEEYSNFSNVLYVYGSGNGIDTYFIKLQDSESIQKYGDVYGIYQNSDKNQYEDLLKDGQEEFDKRKVPQYSFKVEVISSAIEDLKIGNYLLDVELGDYIRYVSKIRGIDDVFRVIELSKTTNGTATLILENKQANLIDEILLTVVGQQGVVPAPFNLTAQGGIIDG